MNSHKSPSCILSNVRKLFPLAVSSSLLLAAILALSVNLKASAGSTWKMPWSSSVSGKVSQDWHSDDYVKTATAIDIALSAGTSVLAPVDSTVTATCVAKGTSDHRAIQLKSADGQIYSLLHVSASNITIGQTFKQGALIGTVAKDTPNDPKCAVSKGIHLHFGLPSQNFLIDGYNFKSFVAARSGVPAVAAFPVVGTVLNSTNPSSPSYPTISVSFTATTASYGANVRSGPGTNFPVVRTVGGNQRIAFDAWTFGSVVNDISLNAPNARWYRIAGTNQWIAGGVVYGNAPNSRPMP